MKKKQRSIRWKMSWNEMIQLGTVNKSRLLPALTDGFSFLKFPQCTFLLSLSLSKKEALELDQTHFCDFVIGGAADLNQQYSISASL